MIRDGKAPEMNEKTETWTACAVYAAMALIAIVYADAIIVQVDVHDWVWLWE